MLPLIVLPSSLQPNITTVYPHKGNKQHRLKSTEKLVHYFCTLKNKKRTHIIFLDFEAAKFHIFKLKIQYMKFLFICW